MVRGESVAELAGLLARADVASISQEFGITLLTARKAVRVLAGEGPGQSRPRLGSYVIPPEDRKK